jgi:hypothetical protein
MPHQACPLQFGISKERLSLPLTNRFGKMQLDLLVQFRTSDFESDPLMWIRALVHWSTCPVRPI